MALGVKLRVLKRNIKVVDSLRGLQNMLALTTKLHFNTYIYDRVITYSFSDYIFSFACLIGGDLNNQYMNSEQLYDNFKEGW